MLRLGAELQEHKLLYGQYVSKVANVKDHSPVFKAHNTDLALSCAFRLQTSVIDRKHLLELDDNPSEGARLVFIGLVRDYNKNRSGVTKIDYQCYVEMAEPEGLAILQAAFAQYNLSRIACVHRIGVLQLQDIAIKLEIASSHRLPALHACEYIMDQIKLLLPIWKKEYYGTKGEWL